MRDDYLLAVVGLPVEDLCGSDATFGHDIHICRASAADSYIFPRIDVRNVGVVKLLLDRDNPLLGALIRIFVLDDCVNQGRYLDLLHRLRNFIRRNPLCSRRLL